VDGQLLDLCNCRDNGHYIAVDHDYYSGAPADHDDHAAADHHHYYDAAADHHYDHHYDTGAPTFDQPNKADQQVGAGLCHLRNSRKRQ